MAALQQQGRVMSIQGVSIAAVALYLILLPTGKNTKTAKRGGPELSLQINLRLIPDVAETCARPSLDGAL